MKRIIFISLSFLLLCVCSCQEELPENLLIGTWDVTVTVQIEEHGIAYGSSPETIYDNWIFTFNKDGSGKIVDSKDSRTSSAFTYLYHQEEGIIDYEMNGIPNKWIVDKLTRTEFRFHSDDESAYAGIVADPAGSTFIGKRKY